MQEVDVVYLYEHAARELDVACAITALLKQNKNLSIEIVQWPVGFPSVVTKIHPRLVILPFCYSASSYEALLAYWHDSKFLNLSWEQFFYSGNKKAKTPSDEFTRKQVVHHAWSTEYGHFLKESDVLEENIFVNGHPAYKLYDEPYKKNFTSRLDLAKRYNLNNSLRWVFFPENYNWAFYSDATIKQFIQNGQSSEDIEIMRDYCKKSLREVLLWFVEATRQKNVEIILRPRPSTPLEEFKNVVRNIIGDVPTHVHIIQNESVREWILASDLTVSSHSTSLIEAAVAEKEFYMLAPFSIPQQLYVDWHDMVDKITTQQQFIDVTLNHSNRNKILSEWAHKHFLNNQDPIKNLAEFISTILSNRLQKPIQFSQKTLLPNLRFIPPAWVWSIYRQLKQFFRFPQTCGVPPEHVPDYIPRIKIQNRIQKWNNLFNLLKS